MQTIKHIVALLLLLPALCIGQEKTAVEIEHSGKDVVGKRYAFEIKEAIRASASMRLVDDDSSTPRIRVVMVTLDPTKGDTGQSTVVSTALLFDSIDMPLSGVFIHSLVETCSGNRVNECVRSTLADIDQAIEKIRKRAPELYKRLRPHGGR